MQVEFGVDMVGFKSRVNISLVIRIITRAAMSCVSIFVIPNGDLHSGNEKTVPPVK
jgi:hypothetical protein